MSDERVSGYYSLEIVAELTGLSRARVRAYERVGLVRPSVVQGQTRLYGTGDLARLRRLRRLSDDLGLNAAGVEVVARLLDEMESLRAEVRALRRRYEPEQTD